MDTRRQLIKRAFSSDSWKYADNTYGQAVAPAMYDELVREYETKNLVIAPLAESYDFTKPGRSFTVTVDVAPSVATLTAETDAAVSSQIQVRQVTFEPKEYTKRYDASYWEIERGFLPFMDNATKKIGYSLAMKKDEVARDTLYAGAGHNLLVNGVSDCASLAATDTFNVSAIVEARKVISKSLYTPYALIIGRDQEADLLNITNIYKANEFGTRQAIEKGLIGNLSGFDIYISDNILPDSNNCEKAIALGRSGMGTSPFGYGYSRLPMIETDKDISFRQVVVVGSEAYDFQVLHPDGICTIGSYAN